MGENAVQDERAEREKLLQALQEDVARLMCSDEVSEEEKLARIKLAQEIIENRKV